MQNPDEPNLPFAQEMSITFRDMQNPDEPDLPFAQEMSITFRDMQNPDEPNLPFAQSSNLLSLSSLSRRQTYYDYTVKGDIAFPFGLGKIDGVKRLTESNADNYRRMGYSVVLIGGTGGTTIPKPPRPTGTTSNGHSHVFETVHPKQTKQLIKIGVDTTKLGVDTTVLGNKLQEAKRERDRIEAKVNANKSEHQDFHDKLQSLGDSLALHSTHSLIPTIPPIPPIIPTSVILVAVGIGAYFLLRRKRQ